MKFGFYWLRTGSVIAIKPGLLIAQKIIFNLLFSTEVRAIIKLVLTWSSRFPVENTFPLIKKWRFLKGFEHHVQNTNSPPKEDLEGTPFFMLTTSRFELLIKRLITIS